MEFDENTIPAFESSYKAGYRGYETDIRMTADGKLVILHDSNLKRTTDTEGVVEEMTEAQIRKARTKKGNKVMFLDELMDWLDSKGDVTYVEFELKTSPVDLYPEERLREYCDKLYERVMRNKPSGATYLFTSGDYRYTLLADGTAEILSYQGTETDITIPEAFEEVRVSAIGKQAFAYNKDLQTVTIPEGITALGDHAFDGFTNLTSFTIPKNITSIGEYAFANCTGLTSLTIPSWISTISVGTFQNCTGLKSFVIPNNVTSIGNFAFNGCTAMTGVVFEEGDETLSLGYNYYNGNGGSAFLPGLRR